MAAILSALLFLLLARTASTQEASPSEGLPTAASASRLEFVDPPFAVPAALRDTIRFAWLTVPQDHADPSSGTFRLAIAIIGARTPQPQSDPIVLIPGGPGSPLVAVAAVDVARSLRLAAFRERRAIVLMDPRGHGLSDPAMCPELNGAQPLEDGNTLAEAILSEKLNRCRAELGSRGVKLETLNAVQTAWDIDALRRALGASQVNLIGSSYGSRLAAEAMRIVPAAIRAVHMDGPVPPAWPHLAPDDARAGGVMTTLFRRCSEQPECRSAFPRLDADYDSLLARVGRDPLSVAMPRSDRVPDGELVADRALLRVGLSQLGLNRQLAAAAPMLIHTLATHGHERLAGMAPRLASMTLEEGDFGTHLAFLCNDSPLTAASATWLPRRCPVWVGRQYGDTLALALQSDIPTLIITGELDPRTPPTYAERVAAGLPRAQVIVAPWTGHERLPDCAFRLASEFFDAPERRVNASCMDSVPPIRFVTAVVPSRWVSGLMAGIASHPLPLSVAIGASAVMLLTVLIGLPVESRRRESADPSVRMARPVERVTWLAAAAGLLALVGVGAAVYTGVAQNPLIPALGIPTGWSWVLILPWLSLGLWFAALALGLRQPRVTRSPIWWIGMAGLSLLLGISALVVLA